MKARPINNNPIVVSKSKEQKALDAEICKMVVELNNEFNIDIDAAILWTLHEYLGLGPKRLRGFWEAFKSTRADMIKHYEMPDDFAWLCRQKLKDIGVDVKAWNDELTQEDIDILPSTENK